MIAHRHRSLVRGRRPEPSCHGLHGHGTERVAVAPRGQHIPDSNQISKHAIPAWRVDALLGILKRWRAQAEKRVGGRVKVIVIQEAGRDGFSVHRQLEESASRVVDPASIAVDRRKRRVKTDRIDVEKLRQTLMAWARGERLVCSFVPWCVRRPWRRRMPAA